MSAPYEPPPPLYDPSAFTPEAIAARAAITTYPSFGAPEPLYPPDLPPPDHRVGPYPYPYRKEVADEILYRISAGETIKAICADSHLPSRTTFLGWVEDDIPSGIADAYHRARRIQSEQSGDLAVDRILRLAVEGERVTMANKDGLDEHEGLLRDPRAAEVLLKTYQWYLGVHHRGKYGAKTEVTISDPDAAKAALARLLGVEPEQLPEE